MDVIQQLKEQARSAELGGQDQAAIDLYARILAEQAESPDPGVLVRMGTLQLRAGRSEEATGTLMRAVDLLRDQGFVDTALAVCRRLLGARPDHAPAYRRLGELSAKKGYPHDARTGYLGYAERVAGNGDLAAFRAAVEEYLRRFPDDAAARQMLTERLREHGIEAERPAPQESYMGGLEELDLLSDEPLPELPPLQTREPERELDAGLDLLPTQLGGSEPPRDELPAIEGLEPTLLEGLEPTSLDSDWGMTPREPEGPAPAPAPLDEEEESLGDPLPLLGMEPEVTALPADDAQSHYDLAVAYRQMGLVDDAIGELQVVLRANADSLPALRLLGECLLEKRDHAGARRVLSRAAQLPGGDEASRLAVHYGLGACAEALGDPREALEWYGRVVAADPGYRDAARRVEALRSA